jgi:dihydrofolate synthase / folylpolyglutamate synthase
MSLNDFLEKKPLYYSEIDYTRMPRAYASIQEKLSIPKIIHIVGTNGKGTTGRFIANALFALGKSTGHYTSPHIQDFNERIWLNGKNADVELLESAHERLQGFLSDAFKNSLSYFEYTTLLAMIVYEKCDYVILEAGLGGEHDATNVFEKVLSVITPIGMDHVDFLGDTIEEIAMTKMRSVTSTAVVAKQSFAEVHRVAKTLEEERDVQFIDYQARLSEREITLADQISAETELPYYLKENLLLAMATLVELGYSVKKNLFNSQRLAGRMEKVDKNVWIDVGHNSLAAGVIAACFAQKSVVLVYNSYKDKDYLSILALLEPIVKRVEIIEIDDLRIAAKEDLHTAISDNGLEYSDFIGIKEDEDYLVFGSFSVAQAFRTMYQKKGNRV